MKSFKTVLAFFAVICAVGVLTSANKVRHSRIDGRSGNGIFYRSDNKRSSAAVTTTTPRTFVEGYYETRGKEKFIIFPKYPTTTAKPKENKPKISSTIAPTLVENSIFKKPPLSVIMAMSKITDHNEFMDKFVIQKPSLLKSSDSSAVHGRASSVPSVSSRARDLSSVPFAPPATCSPQPTTVTIDSGDNPYDVYFPSCTRLERCGGCCSHDLLECAPSKTELVELQVLKTRYLGPPLNKFDTGEMETKTFERHLQCQCQCRVKATDCLPGLQVYRPNECRCECSNQEEIQNCVGDKIWDPSKCSCRCRENVECSTGFTFNPYNCTCEARRVSRMGFGPGFRSL